MSGWGVCDMRELSRAPPINQARSKALAYLLRCEDGENKQDVEGWSQQGMSIPLSPRLGQALSERAPIAGSQRTRAAHIGRACTWLLKACRPATGPLAVPVERLSNTSTRLERAPPRSPDLSHGRPWESNRWVGAHSGPPRGLLKLWLWHRRLPGMRYHLRTSGIAFSFRLARGHALRSQTAKAMHAVRVHLSRCEPPAMAIGATDLLGWQLRTTSIIVRVLHVHHAPPSRQARPPRRRCGFRCRCIACTRPRPCTQFVCTYHDQSRLRLPSKRSSTKGKAAALARPAPPAARSRPCLRYSHTAPSARRVSVSPSLAHNGLVRLTSDVRAHGSGRGAGVLLRHPTTNGKAAPLVRSAALTTRSRLC